MLSRSFAIHAGESHYVRRTSSIHAGFSIDIVESELPGQIGLNLNPKNRPSHRSGATVSHLFSMLAALPEPIELPEQLPRTVNGTGHTGPSEFCATSI